MQLRHRLMDSCAWLDLTTQARVVYLAIRRRYNGLNNGRLALSARDAAAMCKINKDTALKCFQALQEHGFIELAQAGAFSYKIRHAAEWRLTDERCDKTGKLASNAFRQWRPSGAPLE